MTLFEVWVFLLFVSYIYLPIVTLMLKQVYHCMMALPINREIKGGGLHRSNPTVEKAQATWPHQKLQVAFIACRLLLDNLSKISTINVHSSIFLRSSFLQHLAIHLIVFPSNFIQYPFISSKYSFKPCIVISYHHTTTQLLPRAMRSLCFFA